MRSKSSKVWRDPDDFPALVPLGGQKLAERKQRALRLLIDMQHRLRHRLYDYPEREVFPLVFFPRISLPCRCTRLFYSGGAGSSHDRVIV